MTWNLDLFRTELRFAVLGSGSRGNCAVVWSGRHAVLVDCGLPTRRTLAGLKAVGVEPDWIDGIFLTHEHTDHVGGADAIARRLGVPVHCTAGTRVGIKLHPDVQVRTVRAGVSVRCGPMTVEPFAVPHDTAEPVGFVVGVGAHRVGFATDMGSVRESVVRVLRTCRAVLLEFNHDEHMLWHGEYPLFLKERVGSDRGHLSNRQAAVLLSRLAGGRVERVVLGHISGQNNRRDLVLNAAQAALDSSDQDVVLSIADQDTPSAVMHLHDRG